MANCLIGLGSNLGDRGATLQRAVEQLRAIPKTQFLAASSFRETKPAGGSQAQAVYLNAAATIETSLSPQQLLAELQRIENELGRVREERWGPRTIDLDLLLFDQVELETPELTLPHPRMSFRRFVLEPAAEIAGAMVYPINGWTIRWLLSHSKKSNRLISLAPARTPKTNSNAATILLQELAVVDGVIPKFHSPPASFSPEQTKALRRNDRRHSNDHSSCESMTERWIIQDYWHEQWQIEHFHESLPYDAAEANRERLAVVWTGSTTADLTLLDRARRYHLAGPVLWIPHVSLELARQEVIAAMTAME